MISASYVYPFICKNCKEKGCFANHTNLLGFCFETKLFDTIVFISFKLFHNYSLTRNKTVNFKQNRRSFSRTVYYTSKRNEKYTILRLLCIFFAKLT